MNIGLTHIYTGDGKGKTTCAMGLALRAAGCGLKVRIFQFCKTEPSGELKALENLKSVSVMRSSCKTSKFVWDMTSEEKSDWSQAQQALFDEACEVCCSKDADLVILDELLGAIGAGAIGEAEAAYLIDHKYRGAELILTGRGAGQALIDRADYVTEMRLVKHPFGAGVHARRGIEY